MDAKSEILFYQDDVTTSNPVPYREFNSQDGCRGQYYFFRSGLISSIITCVQLNIAMNTVHFNYALLFLKES